MSACDALCSYAEAVHRVTLCLRPSSAQSCKDRKNHILVLYTDSPMRECWSGRVDPDTDTHAYFYVTEASSTLFTARWYADMVTSDGLEAQMLMGGGACAIGDPLLTLNDITGKSQATLSLSSASLPQRKARAIPDNPRARALVSTVDEVHRGLASDKDEIFSFVSVHIGDGVKALPLLWYPLLAMRMQHSAWEAEALFTHLLALASHYAPSSGATSDGQLLADMLTFVSLGWRYTADKTPSDVYADSWASLFTYPNPERAAYDCEDGAKACLELFNVFVGLDLEDNDAPLASIQRLAREYSPFLAVGEIKSEGSYVLHCFMVLLTLDPQTGMPSRKLPAIHIETTAFSSGPWPSNGFDAATMQRDRAEYSACSQLTRDDPAARIRSPVSMVCEQKMYGRLLSLFGCDKARARHWLLGSTDALGLGVDTNAFLKDPTSSVHRIRVALDLSTKELQQTLQRELDLFPLSRLPSAPTEHRGLPLSRRLVLRPDASESQRGVGVMGRMVLGAPAIPSGPLSAAEAGARVRPPA